jgi:hypothetical protein
MEPPQLSEPLLKESMKELLKVGAFINSKGDPAVMAAFATPPSFLALVGLTLVLIGIVWAISETANYYEIRRNWATYRCMPSVTPFAKFYGHDLAETMSFCVGEAVKAHSASVIGPLYAGINEVTGIVEGVFDKVESVEGGVVGLLKGFEGFIVNFANSLRLVGTRVRMSFIRVKEIFERVYGIFIAFAYAAISAITFGENLVCNPLVTFVAGFAGVDICCFAPDTQIVLGDGSRKSIRDVRIGDVLEGGAEVCSTYVFDGTQTPMYILHGIHVSGNHYVCRPEDGALIHVSDHPLARSAPTLPRLWCLGTTNNLMSVASSSGRTIVFADYEESSDPAVVLEAQMTAEIALNGAPAHTHIADYSLGLDSRVLVFMEDGAWMPIEHVGIGARLSSGARVIGVIREVCESVCVSPGGIVVSAAQLIYADRVRGWLRAGTMWPAQEAPNTVLVHLMIDGGQNITIANTTEVLTVRDYAEVSSLDMQAPYDIAISLAPVVKTERVSKDGTQS